MYGKYRYGRQCMKESIEMIRDFMKKDWTMKDKMLAATCCVLLGMTIMSVLVLMKKAVKCLCEKCCCDCDEEDDWDFEEE